MMINMGKGIWLDFDEIYLGSRYNKLHGQQHDKGFRKHDFSTSTSYLRKDSFQFTTTTHGIFLGF